MSETLRIGVLASHRGSNLQTVMDAAASGRLAGEVAVVISNNSGALALARAREAGIRGLHISRRTNGDNEDAAICEALREARVGVVLTLGYMKKLGPLTLETFRGRILNMHPSLLPLYGGQGMYGEHVHAAVIAAGEHETGASIHLVEPEYDTGPVIAQRKVPVRTDDDPASLAARVLAVEHALLVDTLARVAAGDLELQA